MKFLKKGSYPDLGQCIVRRLPECIDIDAGILFFCLYDVRFGACCIHINPVERSCGSIQHPEIAGLFVHDRDGFDPDGDKESSVRCLVQVGFSDDRNELREFRSLPAAALPRAGNCRPSQRRYRSDRPRGRGRIYSALPAAASRSGYRQ